jgi:hypothetical protein
MNILKVLLNITILSRRTLMIRNYKSAWEKYATKILLKLLKMHKNVLAGCASMELFILMQTCWYFLLTVSIGKFKQ